MAKQVDSEEDETGEEERPRRGSTRSKDSTEASKKAAPADEAEEEESGEDESDDDESDDDADESESESKSDEPEEESDASEEVAAGADDDAQAKLDDAVDEAIAGAAREGEEEDTPAGQLGIGKYVFSAYLGCGFLLAYVVGRTIHDLWAHFANRDWFTKFSAKLAGIPDTDAVLLNKMNISLAIGFLVALIVMLRTYRKPSTRQWTDDVTSEIVKVRWPTRKEVTNSTIVVITASLAATGYLFVLDRLWSFITNLVYGSGT